MAIGFNKHIEPYIIDVSHAWRILGRLGLVDTIFNHISAVAGDEEGKLSLIMNPSGRLSIEVYPEHLCVFALKEYMPSEAARLGVIKDGLHMHSAMHSLRRKVGAIIHTHSPYSIAVGCSESGLQSMSQTAMEFLGELKMIDYDGMFRNQILSESISNLAIHGGVALLRHHGSLVVADSIAEAFYLAYYIEEACKIQVLTLSQGVPLIIPEKSSINEAHQLLQNDRKIVAKQLFEAFCRQLENKNASNKTTKK
ncbi:MAG: class II aldolase/adducin family protein [Ignavibacteriales bacterium]|nr:class II aldolase/adducin family protein [Ignavibacteriales bacterium]